VQCGQQPGLVACLATGPSLPGLLASLPESVPTITVNDAWRLRPDCVALVAQDAAWWRANPGAVRIAGRRFSAAKVDRVEELRIGGLYTGTNSGLAALYVAKLLGYTKALLLGYDIGGAHYFGAHQHPLKNPGPNDFARFLDQFKRARRSLSDIEIINCTPGSALTCFPFASLSEAVQ
jgi:hypothetical protein